MIPLPGFAAPVVASDASPERSSGSFELVGMTRQGVYAQYVVLPESVLVPDTTGLPSTQVATLPMAICTGVRAVKTVGEVNQGQRVLVHAGASGTGSMNIQIAKALGAMVASTVHTPEKADFVRELGADLVLDLSAPDFNDKIRDWAPAGVDVVIDNLGGAALTKGLGVLKQGGILVAMGFVCGAEVTFNVQQLFFGQHQIRGTMMGERADLEWGLQQVESGHIKPSLDQVFPLNQAASAHSRLAEGRARGSIVLQPWS